jgi:CRISPR-associated protein Cas2
MDVILIYDIATPDAAGQRRLARVARACEGFGVRVQYSVFECRLTDADYVHLEDKLRGILEPSTDRVTIYRVSGDVSLTRTDLGLPTMFGADGNWIV